MEREKNRLRIGREMAVARRLEDDAELKRNSEVIIQRILNILKVTNFGQVDSL